MTYPFEEFPKIARLKREIVITEKIDGTNAQVAWVELKSLAELDDAIADPFCLGVYDHEGNATALYAGSRSRWLLPTSDNFGFCRWVVEHAEELRALGPGRHFGEWWGAGIQRRYGQIEKRFSLFNVARWGAHNPNTPACVRVVPILARGEGASPELMLKTLTEHGSFAAPGFMEPEGIVVYHSASRQLYKLTLEHDGGKWNADANVAG